VKERHQHGGEVDGWPIDGRSYLQFEDPIQTVTLLSVMKFVSLFAGLLLASREAAAFTAPRPSTAHAHSTSTARPRPTALSVLPESLDLLAAVSSSSLLSADNVVSPEPIHTAFTVATFFSQPFFLLMILAPQAKTTKQIMGGLGTCCPCCQHAKIPPPRKLTPACSIRW
jgi:hypothetical protein